MSIQTFQDTNIYGPAIFLLPTKLQDQTINTTVELDNNRVISIKEEEPAPVSSSLARGLLEAEKFLKRASSRLPEISMTVFTKSGKTFVWRTIFQN